MNNLEKKNNNSFIYMFIIIVLDGVKHTTAAGEPLYLDVLASLHQFGGEDGFGLVCVCCVLCVEVVVIEMNMWL
jgi:hypothetical protein